MAKDNNGAVGTYILIVLILGVITYVEFAIVEYPQAWLGQTWTLIVLAVLSVLKFLLVVMFFMHLKGDDRMYSGFFSSGMVIALATFIAMTAMFILPRAMSYNRSVERIEAQQAAGDDAHGHGAEVPADVEELIATDGASRSAAARADTPAPADRSAAIEAPRAANDGSSFEVAGAAGATPADQAAADDEAQDEEPLAGPVDPEADQQPETEAEGLQAEPEAEQAEETAADDAGEVAVSGDWDRELGAQVYSANCVGCHQGAGQGIPGAFPPLAGHAADIYAEGGRELLVQTVLFGLQGQIQADGMTYNGFMPGWPQLNDEQIAGVLNHVVAELGDEPSGFDPYTAADVAGHRGDGLSPNDVLQIRSGLGLD